jgi:hypothetical protein
VRSRLARRRSTWPAETLGLLRDLAGFTALAFLVGAAICAGLVFAAGVAVVSVRGARAWFR